ncbi:MAG: tetratricopeptide repeat protein, partial [bacterium]
AGLGFDRFTRWQYLMTQFGVILYYLRLVVLPAGQTFDYDWKLAHTPFAPDVFLPLLLLGGLVYAAWRLRHTQPLFTFAIGFMLVVLAPTSSLMPIADLAVERRMYLPLAGLMLFGAAGLRDLAALAVTSAAARDWAYGTGLGLLLAVASVLTLLRAELWGHPIELHEDGVAKAPENPRVRLNLGVTYLNSGMTDQAADTLQIAKTLYDRGESVQAFERIGAFIHYNLGAVRFTKKQYDAAEPDLRRSLELGGQYLALRPMANMLLSRIAEARGDWPAAATLMQEALKYQDVADWRVDLANMQWKAGDAAAARTTLDKTLVRYPGLARAVELRQRIDAAS